MDEQKQYYRIYGMPFAMQVWLYECCSAFDPKIAVRRASRIPRLLNWETTNRRPYFEAFIEGMLADVDNPITTTVFLHSYNYNLVVYGNITPTSRELTILQLPFEDAVEDTTSDNVSLDDDFQDASSTTGKNKGKEKVKTEIGDLRKLISDNFKSVMEAVKAINIA
ncbi:hypothetical protein FXO37_33203 [Capsicum annuum]|nr:hypothetical protein FXO37_33203 [Capsicum annuum]